VICYIAAIAILALCVGWILLVALGGNNNE